MPGCYFLCRGSDSVLEEVRGCVRKNAGTGAFCAALDYNMRPVEEQPYAEYTVQIDAEGYEPKEVTGTEVLPEVLAQQPASLVPNPVDEESYQRIVIVHTLFENIRPRLRKQK